MTRKYVVFLRNECSKNASALGPRAIFGDAEDRFQGHKTRIRARLGSPGLQARMSEAKSGRKRWKKKHSSLPQAGAQPKVKRQEENK
jgi:hypothetical protein